MSRLLEVPASKWHEKWGSAIGILLFLAILGSIWLPEFTLWYVRPQTPSDEVITMARTAPADAVLTELGQMDLKPTSSPAEADETIRRAEGVVRGVLSIPGFPDIRISPVFSAADLQKGSPKWQLIFASLAAADVLLDAYTITGREEFFRIAKDNIVAFAHFESSRLLDTGFLWNDHAIGARIPVLIKFWAQYRQRADFDPAVARAVLLLVARSGLLLAKPEHYAWRTGHGMVQNLALMQIAAAFPYLAESAYLREVAMLRFSTHLAYYVNREGVTLLHSAGYHASGLKFFAMALRLHTLNQRPIPDEWWTRYQKALDFYALLRRPDGSLPMFGDTGSDADRVGPTRTRPLAGGAAAPLIRATDWPYPEGIGLYPEAGYAAWWYPRKALDSQTRAQTVLTWSYYPGQGHKLADELSVLLWARGMSWITNVGYWPYGHPGRPQAESWEGSNAPHLRAEPPSSRRSARLTRVGIGDEAVLVEMERRGPGEFMVRREVLQIGSATWIVLDRQRDAGRRETVTNWTFYPGLTVTPGSSAGSFLVTPASPSAPVMHCSFQMSPGGQLEQRAGSEGSIAGWVAIGEMPVPANTIVVRSGSENSWQLAVFSVREGDGAAIREQGLVVQLSGAEDFERWTMEISGAPRQDAMTIVRDGEQIRIVEHGIATGEATLKLDKIPDPQAEIAPVLAAFQASTERSERRVQIIPYRLKVSYLLFALLVAQELGFALLGRFWPRWYGRLRAATVITWVGAGFWLTQVYLVAG